MKRESSGIRKKTAHPARKSAGARSAATRTSPSRVKPKKAAKLKRTKTTAKPKAARKKVAKTKAAATKAISKTAVKIVTTVKPKRKTTRRSITKRTRSTAAPNPVESPASSAKTDIAVKSVVKTVKKWITPGAPVADLAFHSASIVEAAPTKPTSPKTSSRPKKKAKKVAASKSTTPKDEPPIPAFLLEGDEPSYPDDLSGPGEKFALGPTPPLDHFDEAKAPLPESYGTGKLFLTVRDPHWLYAHWDLTREEQFRHNAQSEDRHLILRLYSQNQPQSTPAEIHVHPESKYWFIHVDRAGESYFTELGYYQHGHKWHSLAYSEPQRTPPDSISRNAPVKFATIPPELSFDTMLALLRENADTPNRPLAHAIDQIRPRAREHFPTHDVAGDWSAEQEKALAQILARDRARATLPSSQEFAAPAEREWPEFFFNLETGEAVPAPAPSSDAYVSSFFGGNVPKDFWLNVNAELVIYGATAPDASVTFAGKKIPLRPDGSFRFRFSLPDGQYELPISAVAADESDTRAVELKFSRATKTQGEVETHPQDPALSPPPPKA